MLLAVDDFNSIKVRLEQKLFKDPTNLINSFQFHKGAIRTQRNLIASVDNVISIP